LGPSKKVILIATCVILLIIGFHVFSKNVPQRKSLVQNTRIVADMLGNAVKFPVPLERVALFGGPTGQIAYMLGVQDKLCAITTALKTSTLIRT